MKMVLCSEGFYTDNTVQACVDLCGKPKEEISVAVINEAFAVQQGDKRWVLNNLNSVANTFPAELDIVNLLALSSDEVERSIASKDVIFVVGGNPDFLMHTFDTTGFSTLLPKLLEEKVYVGSSAGSMVMGRKLPTDTITNLYDEEPYGNVSEYLGFVDLAILPHLGSDHFPNSTQETINKNVPRADFPIYGLRDDSALLVNGEIQEFIGSKPHRATLI